MAYKWRVKVWGTRDYTSIGVGRGENALVVTFEQMSPNDNDAHGRGWWHYRLVRPPRRFRERTHQNCEHLSVHPNVCAWFEANNDDLAYLIRAWRDGQTTDHIVDLMKSRIEKRERENLFLKQDADRSAAMKRSKKLFLTGER